MVEVSTLEADARRGGWPFEGCCLVSKAETYEELPLPELLALRTLDSRLPELGDD